MVVKENRNPIFYPAADSAHGEEIIRYQNKGMS